MRALPIVLAGLPGIALAQSTDLKIYPGAVTRFDQACTSYTSRCALGGNAGEILQEYPMQSQDASGAATDFFRGIGEAAFPNQRRCSLLGVFYLTQDENCSTRETYDVVIRVLHSLGRGPDPSNATAPIPPGSLRLMTPPNGQPIICSWGISVTFATPVPVPCDRSIFAGLGLAAAPLWTNDGQSLQGAWRGGGGATFGDPAAPNAPEISWQVSAAGVAGQCGTARVWDYGLMVGGPSLNLGNRHGDPICPVDPACGIGGLYPDGNGRGDGLALCVRDATAPNGTGVFSFIAANPAPIGITLAGILDKSLWIGPSPFVQISFGGTRIGAGQAVETPVFLAPGSLTGFSGSLWFQSIVNNGTLPLHTTNAAAFKQ